MRAMVRNGAAPLGCGCAHGRRHCDDFHVGGTRPGQSNEWPRRSPTDRGAARRRRMCADGGGPRWICIAVHHRHDCVADLGACSAGVQVPEQHSFGEVVSVTTDQQSFPRSGPGHAPDPGICRSAADDYVDWPDRTWAAVSTRTVLLLGPDISQYLSGQRWIACAIVPAAGSYLGSIRDDRNRSAANAFGQCRSLRASGLVPVPCGDPHETEIFGTATGNSSDAVALSGSCADLLSAVMKTADPTAGGQLRVKVVPDRLLGSRNCEVQVPGNRLLHGSLLGWGDQPLPLS